MSSFVVAVDGPAGSGKSSVSRAAAGALDFAFLDTGAAYRALAWLAMERGLARADGVDVDAVIALAQAATIEIGTDPLGYRVVAEGTDITEAIRTARVAAIVSQVARIGLVRTHLISWYRRVIDQAVKPGIVVEGRDITTVVAPDAQLRVLLTASAEVRARRRASELGVAGQTERAQVAAAMSRRDQMDLGNVDFMTPAPGVTLLDTSNLDFDAAVAALIALARQAGAPHPISDEPSRLE